MDLEKTFLSAEFFLFEIVFNDNWMTSIGNSRPSIMGGHVVSRQRNVVFRIIKNTRYTRECWDFSKSTVSDSSILPDERACRVRFFPK